MKDELLVKIQRVIDGRLTNEMKVVYLLVELRKLLDRETYQDPVLRTFSNWVVHTDLAKRGDGSTLVLTQFDEFFAELYEKKTVSKERQHLSLGTFRLSLVECFKHFGLSATFTNDFKQWKQFSRLYCLIVSECPMVFTASKIPLKYIKKVELEKVGRGMKFKDWEWPVVQWKISFIDGTTVNWAFQMG